jgi:hypothetical protein
MSRPRSPTPGAAGAGILLLTVVLVCGAIGGGIGAAIGAFAPLLIAGIFAGFLAGTWVVYRRFRDL